MCGILGGVSLNPDESSFKEALELISHRGPNNTGYENIGNTLLGHTRLSIIDLSSSSNQPLWDCDRKACITFNGEIYNYKVIREKLKAQGVRFRTEGDAEVILNLYLYGEANWIKELSGMFSFAIWDAEKQELFLARDPFGVKPLYYTECQNGFYFSSEIKALLKASGSDRCLNYDAILRTIVFLWSPGPETVLKNVLKLEPGNILIVKDRSIISHVKYWEWPDYDPNNIPISESIEKVAKSLELSVTEQMVSDVPIGAFLSGGLDSSLIAALVKKSGVEKLQCFTIKNNRIGRNDGFSDDLPYAVKVSEFLGFDLNVVDADPDITLLLEEVIYHLDEPQADTAPFNVMMICKLAREKGIRVLLSGAGGDDVFTGYRRHRAIQLESYWSGLPKILRKTLQNVARTIPKKNPSLRRLSKAFSYAGLDAEERILSYFYWIDPEVVRGLFVRDVQEKLSVSPMDDMISAVKSKGDKDSLEKMLYLERRYFLVDHNLNYTDKLSMASGVEVRVPFLDRKLADVASEIDVKYKQRKNTSKWVLKKSAEPYLPAGIIYRPKTGFGGPLRYWLSNDLKPMIDDYLSAENIQRRGIFDYSKISKLIELDRSGKEDYSYPIFAILCIEVWCKVFLDDARNDATGGII